MAITLVGTASANAINGGAVTVTLPAGTTTNDLVLVMFAMSSDFSPTIATTGYTTIVNTILNTSLIVGWKIMGGTPDTTVASTGSFGINYGLVGCVMVFRGIDLTTPIDSTTTLAAGSSTNPDPPSITTTNGGAVVAIAASEVNDASITIQAGYSNLTTNTASDTQSESGAMSWKNSIAASTAENPAAFTTWSTGLWAAATVALRSNSTIFYTFTADVGAFSFTGIAALQKFTFNAAVGAFTLTGIAAVLSWGRTLTAAVGTFVFTGIDATLQAIRTMTAAVGAFTFTGIAAVLSFGKVLAADVGAFALTGIAVVWQRTMNAAVGAFTLTGIAATLQAIRTMTAAVGTFVFTGVAATLTSGRTLTAAVGTFVFTGIANIMGKSALDLTYRLKRRATTFLAKVRVAEPVLALRRVAAPALKKLRSRDPSLSQ